MRNLKTVLAVAIAFLLASFAVALKADGVEGEGNLPSQYRVVDVTEEIAGVKTRLQQLEVWKHTIDGKLVSRRVIRRNRPGRRFTSTQIRGIIAVVNGLKQFKTAYEAGTTPYQNGVRARFEAAETRQGTFEQEVKGRLDKLDRTVGIKPTTAGSTAAPMPATAEGDSADTTAPPESADKAETADTDAADTAGESASAEPAAETTAPPAKVGKSAFGAWWASIFSAPQHVHLTGRGVIWDFIEDFMVDSHWLMHILWALLATVCIGLMREFGIVLKAAWLCVPRPLGVVVKNATFCVLITAVMLFVSWFGVILPLFQYARIWG
jgi:hypothetical protein